MLTNLLERGMRRLLDTSTAFKDRLRMLVPRPVRLKLKRWLGRGQPYWGASLYVDLVGSCTLKCPSCPVGNSAGTNPKGLMDVELFRQIVAHAKANYTLTHIGLYNWTEPLIHPQLAEMIKIVRAAGFRCHLSSNLNGLGRDIDGVLAAGPDWLRISLSGFTQPVYKIGHAPGDVEKVKANMRLLREAIDRTGSPVKVSVFYIKYKHNLDEVEPMRAYAQELGFDLDSGWALYMPIEKMVRFREGTLPEPERAFVRDYLALPLDECLDEAVKYKDEDCTLLSDMIPLDFRGNVQLCCGVYDQSKYSIGSFLTMSKEEIDRARRSHSMCTTCSSYGIHVHSEYANHPQLSRKYPELVQLELSRSRAATARKAG